MHREKSPKTGRRRKFSQKKKRNFAQKQGDRAKTGQTPAAHYCGGTYASRKEKSCTEAKQLQEGEGLGGSPTQKVDGELGTKWRKSNTCRHKEHLKFFRETGAPSKKQDRAARCFCKRYQSTKERKKQKDRSKGKGGRNLLFPAEEGGGSIPPKGNRTWGNTTGQKAAGRG